MESPKRWLRLRVSERVLLGYFAYVAAIAPFFRDRPHLHWQPLLEFVAVAANYAVLSMMERIRKWRRTVQYLRDWIPIFLLLAGFWEMELFLPRSYPRIYEGVWQSYDHVLLHDWHLRSAIERLGPFLPGYLECCYLLVYGVGPICLGVLYKLRERAAVDRFLTVYLIGTLMAYSLFPYFPSQPPRIAFAGLDTPQVITWMRRLNLAILAKGTIHIGVFPSAHVSAAFSAAWGFFLLLPKKRILNWSLLAFACSVSVATIYGRYHYSADVLAGVAVSLTGVAALVLGRRTRGEVKV